MAAEAIPEQRLWQCVIVQTIRDALQTRLNLDPRDDIARDEARRWFDTGGRDFDTVCGNAGIDASRLRQWWREIKVDPRQFKSARDAFNGFNTHGGHTYAEAKDAA
jgi:hypothetical protein